MVPSSKNASENGKFRDLYQLAKYNVKASMGLTKNKLAMTMAVLNHFHMGYSKSY